MVGQFRPRMYSTREELPNDSDKTSARGKRFPEQAITVIPTNLISGSATVLARSKAGALAEVQQRINPKLRQEICEFRLEEFLKTVERTRCADG
jgi:hypothetical protein